MEPREAFLISYWLDRYVPRTLFDARLRSASFRAANEMPIYMLVSVERASMNLSLQCL